MFVLQFTMYGGGYVNFMCEYEAVYLLYIKNYLEGLEKIKEKGMEALIFADDNSGNHVAMVRCSQVCGYSLLDLSKDPREKLSNALIKNLDSGNEWKGEQ